MSTRRLARIVALVSTVVATSAIAQSAQGAPKSAVSAAGFETGSYYGGPRVWIGNLNGAVAVGAQIERGLTQPGTYGPGIISGGVGIDYYAWDFAYTGGKYSYSVVPLQAFSNYHFVIPSNKRIDPYLGVALVYSIVNASWSGAGVQANADASSLDFAGQAGARYFINDKFAVQGQIGFGYGTLGVGATWRF